MTLFVLIGGIVLADVIVWAVVYALIRARRVETGTSWDKINRSMDEALANVIVAVLDVSIASALTVWRVLR